METEIKELKEFIFKTCALPSVSGFEKLATESLIALVGERMELAFVDGVGNHVFVKRCGKEGAPKILVDTHFDEIGFMVTDITEEGFLRVTPLGGIDPSILQAADVTVYGKENLRGVICATPPHLKKDDKLTPADEALVDVGLSKKDACELIRLGDSVGFSPVYLYISHANLILRPVKIT